MLNGVAFSAGLCATNKGLQMKQKDIEKAEKLAAEIQNFRDCYASCVLWGSAPDGDVKAEKLIEWMIENPHMAQIAEEIRKHGA
jgi:hypothetical protein